MQSYEAKKWNKGLSSNKSSVHLKEVDVVPRAGQLLQLAISLPDLHHLSLDLLQQLLSLSDSRPLLEAEQLRHFSAVFLDGADQPGENPLALLHRRLRGVLCRGKCWEVVAALKPLWEEKTLLTLMYPITYLSSFSTSFSFWVDFKEASWSFF